MALRILIILPAGHSQDRHRAKIGTAKIGTAKMGTASLGTAKFRHNLLLAINFVVLAP